MDKPALVLDTMIARGFGHGDVDPAPFLHLRLRGVRIHLADGAVVELISQIETGKLEWPTWVKTRRNLCRVLDRTDPVLLGGGDGLAWKTGAPSVRSKGTDQTLDYQRALVHTAWKLTVKAKDLKSLRGTQTVKIGRRVVRTALQVGEATQAVAEMKTAWTRSFSEILKRGLALASGDQKSLPAGSPSPKDIERTVADLACRIDADYPTDDPPPMSERLDAMIRVFALHSLRRLRSKDPYNAEKHANDVLDHDLLRYLAYPVAICTRDTGIHADLRTTSARHRSWVLRPDEIAGPDVLERLRAVRF